MTRLPELWIGIDKATQQFEDKGLKKLDETFYKLMETLTKTSLE